MEDKQKWSYEIDSKRGLFRLNLNEVWEYRDLLFLFVKRDVITAYKQTVLGPLWYLIEPLFTSIIFTLIFNNVANIPTGQVPPFLFNLAGVTIWNYFKSCLTKTSNTFAGNAGVFGKVYFPRLIVPISSVISNLIRFAIQIFVFFVFFCYFYFYKDANIGLNRYVFLFPILVILMGMLGLGLGMIISSLVTKYRDFKILLNFGVQLLMYVSAVMYPISFFKERLPKYVWVVEYNPLTFIIDTTRFLLLDIEYMNLDFIMFSYSIVISIITLLLGIMIFNRAEKNFIDTV